MPDIDRVLRSNLKLKHLQLLVALDEFRHLGRASEFLSLTQPAVSKTLAEIERMFGLALFLRSTRGTEPTAYGGAVVRFARTVLADYGRTQDEIAAVASGGAGRTSVGAMVVATPGLLTRAVELLKAQSSQTTVSIEEGDLTRLLPRLRIGRARSLRRPAGARVRRTRSRDRGAVQRAHVDCRASQPSAAAQTQAHVGRSRSLAMGGTASLGVVAYQAQPNVLQASLESANGHYRVGVVSRDGRVHEATPRNRLRSALGRATP